MKRVVSPERASRLKSMNPEAASREARTRNVLKVNHANQLTLDISSIKSSGNAVSLEHIQTRHADDLSRKS